MRNQFKILFYLKRKEKLRNGRLPIMCRISVNGRFCSFSTFLSVDERLWHPDRKRLSGRSDEARRINALLDEIHYSVYDAYMQALRSSDEVTPQAVRRGYLGGEEGAVGLISFFDQHNAEFESMVGLNRSKSTLYKYRYVCNHLRNYIIQRYNRTDISLQKVNRTFVCDFHRWLAEAMNCGTNTMWIYMIAFKHIMLLAVSRGLLGSNPFTGYKLHSEHTDKNFLMKDELRRLSCVTLDSPARQLVLDAFLFSCFTGLSFSDVGKFSMNDIVKRNGKLYISTHRMKTGTSVDVPLLRVPHRLIMKYYDGDDERAIFRLTSNGWCNRMLKTALRNAGINRRLTFHSARHTFATTVTLANGVPIEVVSRMLGHTDIKTTQIYAKVLQTSVSSEMQRISKNIDSYYDIPVRRSDCI